MTEWVITSTGKVLPSNRPGFVDTSGRTLTVDGTLKLTDPVSSTTRVAEQQTVGTKSSPPSAVHTDRWVTPSKSLPQVSLVGTRVVSWYVSPSLSWTDKFYYEHSIAVSSIVVAISSISSSAADSDVFDGLQTSPPRGQDVTLISFDSVQHSFDVMSIIVTHYGGSDGSSFSESFDAWD